MVGVRKYHPVVKFRSFFVNNEYITLFKQKNKEKLSSATYSAVVTKQIWVERRDRHPKYLRWVASYVKSRIINLNNEDDILKKKKTYVRYILQRVSCEN